MTVLSDVDGVGNTGVCEKRGRKSERYNERDCKRRGECLLDDCQLNRRETTQ